MFSSISASRFFYFRICIYHSSNIICKHEKISFAQKSYRVDLSDQICIYKLIGLFHTFLKISKVSFYGFG